MKTTSQNNATSHFARRVPEKVRAASIATFYHGRLQIVGDCYGAYELESFEFERLVEIGDEVLVTYESTTTEGRRLRNTEIRTFEGDRIRKVEVYFGWDVES